MDWSVSDAHRSHDKIAVLFIDVDRFKTINDSLGHSVGDALLQEVTERLQSSLGEGDTLARWGGDEFALLTPFTQAGDAAKQARALLESLEKQMVFNGQPLHVTASIGIALYPTDGNNAQVLMQNAGTALHRAKDLGRNTYQFYNAAMNAQATTRLSLENDLRLALQREQLQLYYQPQIDTQSGEILGFEALLRWNHPKLGLLLPNRFIPIAEESGLITVMTDWILTSACKQMCRWHQMGFTWLHVAVNLSAREFQQPQLLSLVSQVLEKTGLPPPRPGTRNYRKRGHARCQPHHPDSFRAEENGRTDFNRRLRYRVFFNQLLETVSLRYSQNRPVVHCRSGHQRQRRPNWALGDQPRSRAESQGCGRRG